MNAITAIESIGDLVGKLHQLQFAIDCEADGITEQWDELKRLGGAREDHAAALLSRLRPALRALAELATTAEHQIDAVVADPFERNNADSCEAIRPTDDEIQPADALCNFAD